MCASHKRDRNCMAFTLVELLVVISIIALLLAILMPSLSKAREIAKRLVCSTNLHGVGQSLFLYANENKDRYPPRACPHSEPICSDCKTLASYGIKNYLPASYNYSFVNSAPPGTFYIYLGKLWKEGYIVPKTMFCPSAKRGTSYDYYSQFVESKREYGIPVGRTSYSYRCAITDEPGISGGSDSKVSEVRNGALVFDKVGYADDGISSDFRHGTAQNVLYGDGSTRTITETDKTSVIYYSGWNDRLWLDRIKVLDSKH